MVGFSPVHLESPKELSLDSLIGPLDPLCTAGSVSLDFLNESPITDVPAALGAQSGLCGSDFADIPDAELEKILSPFSRGDPSSDLEYWDLELLMAS